MVLVGRVSGEQLTTCFHSFLRTSVQNEFVVVSIIVCMINIRLGSKPVTVVLVRFFLNFYNR